MSTVDGSQVEDATMAVLQEWLSYHLAEVEAGHGMERGTLARPAHWQIIDDTVDVDVASGTPKIALQSPGLEGERPQRRNHGEYSASWRLYVWAFTASGEARTAHKTARMYAAAIRDALVWHLPTGDPVSEVLWLDENYVNEGAFSNRHLASSRVDLRVVVHGAIGVYTGPGSAPDDPYVPPADAVPVRQVEIQVQDTGQGTTRPLDEAEDGGGDAGVGDDL